MNGGIAKLFGYLGKVHMLCPDQFLGGIDLEDREIFYDPQVTLFLKNLLELGASYQIVAADLFNTNMLADVFLQIV